MKEKNWKYLTIVLVIVGVISLIFSSISAHPTEIESTHPLVDKTKKYEMINGGTLQASIFTDLDPSDLDQLQDQLDASLKIGVGSKGCSILQPVINDREPMTGFQVIVARHGTPSSDLWIGIMYPHRRSPFDGQNYMIASYFTPAQIPNEDVFYWGGMDLGEYPLDISPGTPALHIVVMSTDNPDDSNYWLWGCSTTNTYSNYHPYGWNVNDEEWQDDILPDAWNKDMCFATYTSAGGNGDIPEITISTTTWVTTGLGIFSLIGAFLSGSKYFGWI